MLVHLDLLILLRALLLLLLQPIPSPTSIVPLTMPDDVKTSFCMYPPHRSPLYVRVACSGLADGCSPSASLHVTVWTSFVAGPTTTQLSSTHQDFCPENNINANIYPLAFVVSISTVMKIKPEACDEGQGHGGLGDSLSCPWNIFTYPRPAMSSMLICTRNRSIFASQTHTASISIDILTIGLNPFQMRL
ncbi:hypothetical protein BJ165DRAFT_1409817 [Panaeolus papilionaceus]|nr:hypothetical protein BJ165DRAFT_1409817 [Panaeolus papilionaceus]